MYQASSIVIFTILYSAVNGLSCTYRFPAYHKPHTCLEYDLTMLSHYGPYNISSGDSISSGGYSTLYVKVCDFISTDFPDVCVSKFNSKSPATAYAYSNEGGCYPIGKLEYDFAYPLDPLDGSVGIRVAYTSKDDGNGVWSRGIIYDLYCDKSGVQYRPTFSYEYPEYTYRVTWHTGYACPSVLTGEKCNRPKFDSNWDSLRFRTHPSWFKRAKFGIFVVWGLYSVPAFMNEWYQKRLMEGVPEYVEFHNRVYGCSGVLPEKFPCTGPIFKFQDFAPMFKAELFDPDYLASVFKKSGAKYVVFTTKHHSGWTNFPSAQHWNYNSEDVGPHMDLTGNLTASVKAQGLYMGLYHSLREWFHPLYLQDQANNCTTTAFVDEILIPTLKDMVNRYKPDIVWADGAGDAPCTHDSVKYWKTPEFFSWLYNESPVRETVLTNSRWGSNAIGSYMEGNDRFTPLTLIKNEWETPYTIQEHSWGYDRVEDINYFINTTHLLWQLVTTVSCNGNLLLNVGPMADGTLDPVFEERLLDIGKWLEINGEAIYDTIPWKFQQDTPSQDIWYTASEDWSSVYAITFRAPLPGGEIVLMQPNPSKQTAISLLGAPGLTLDFQFKADALHISFPSILPFNALAGKGAWTIKLTNVM